jgi:predicted ribosome quality control (RQC) complex YloA/Tae2 family protein
VLATVEELRAVADELDQGLRGAVVQKVYSPAPQEVWLELRQVGRSTLLCICARAGAERLSVADQRPESPKVASGFQQRLRKLLVSERVAAVTFGGVFFEGHTLRADFMGHKLELAKAEPVEPRDQQPSDFPLARALEKRVGTVEIDRERVEREGRIKKLKRTREKVVAEAARGPAAERMKEEGELLARNLHAVPRGAKSVKLTEYAPDGEVREREVKLDPKRTPKQQVEWLFHQYKRLQRGAAIAAERLKKLDAEIRALEEGGELPVKPAAVPRAPDAPSQPYREYVSATGKRIWVGRGAQHNDALTFRHARPHHLWLHARGVPGAHVVVPLEKKESIDQQTLLDAAHLALHHSDLKGERAGEVSYTHVKYVRKAGAPGAVTYTHDTTFWLRVEPPRLERLVAG